MGIDHQIRQLRNPQEFTRFMQIVFAAEFGDDFMTSNDDMADGGNDGYIKSLQEVISRHCFKESLTRHKKNNILTKAESDLSKIIDIKSRGDLAVQSWRFVTAYDLPADVLEKLQKEASTHGLNFTHTGPAHLADMVRRNPGLQDIFEWLVVPEVADKIDKIDLKVDKIQKQLGAVDSTQNSVVTKNTSSPSISAEKLGRLLSQPSVKEVAEIALQGCSVENREKLNVIRYKSKDRFTSLQATLALIDCFDPIIDNFQETADMCAYAAVTATDLGLHFKVPELKAQQGKLLSNQLDLIYINKARQDRLAVTIGEDPVPHNEQMQDFINRLIKDSAALMKDALHLARETNNMRILANVSMHVGSAAGGRATVLLGLGDRAQAMQYKSLCKTSYLFAKELAASFGDDYTYTVAIHNLSNHLRSLEEPSAAEQLANEALVAANKLGDNSLIKQTTRLLERIKTGKIPDYINGERD